MSESWDDKFDAHMKRLEDRIEEIGKKGIDKAQQYGYHRHVVQMQNYLEQALNESKPLSGQPWPYKKSTPTPADAG